MIICRGRSPRTPTIYTRLEYPTLPVLERERGSQTLNCKVLRSQNHAITQSRKSRRARRRDPLDARLRAGTELPEAELPLLKLLLRGVTIGGKLGEAREAERPRMLEKKVRGNLKPMRAGAVELDEPPVAGLTEARGDALDAARSARLLALPEGDLALNSKVRERGGNSWPKIPELFEERPRRSRPGGCRAIVKPSRPRPLSRAV